MTPTFTENGDCLSVMGESLEDRFWTPAQAARLTGCGRDASGATPPRQKGSSLGYVAAGLAHDLNNVLAPVITSLEVLRLHCAGDEKALQILTLLERQARQGPFLVRQISSLAQGMENEHSQVHPAATVRALRKQITDSFPAGIKTRVNIPAGLWPILGSATHVYQALYQICRNACEAMAEGGVLTVSVENALINDEYPFVPVGTAAARYVMFSVADTGCGIPDEVIDRIFEERFTTKAATGGLGVGLYRANQIVESHNGHITVGSQVGCGATFRIYVPAAPGTLPDLSSDDEKLLRGHGEGILVVDDEEAIRSITRETFESFGYRVILASNGADAVSTYLHEDGNIALVFTDMSMPIMDGESAIHTLRDINPSLKIIATSGLDAPSQHRRASHAGADRFIAKPYTAADLLRIVHETLSN